MSGCSGDGPCPRCGKTMDTYSDYKPFDYVSGECMYCGFYYYVECRIMSRKTLKEARKDRMCRIKSPMIDNTETKLYDKENHMRRDR
jgi:hypothetical protein